MHRKEDYSDSLVEEPSWSGQGTSLEEKVMNSIALDSNLGKLKHLCPSFLSTLSAYDIVCLNISMATAIVDIYAITILESPIRELEREGENFVLVGSMVLDGSN